MGEKEGSWQSLGGLIVVGLYVLTGWIVGQYYWWFRVSGGLHGHVSGKGMSKQEREYRGSIAQKSAANKDDGIKEALL